MEKFFKLKEHNVSFKSETLAALTSYFASVYILIVNASILSDSNVEVQPLIIATVLSSALGTILVAFFSNAPLIIMPAMGLNALFTYTMVNNLGLTFYEALGSVFISGILFLIIAVTPISKLLMEGIPDSIKESITIGIGLFITFLGLQKSGIVVADSSTLISLGNLKSPNVILFIIVMLLTIILFIRNVRGSFLISIIVGTIIASFMGIIDLKSLTYTMPDFKEYKNIFFSMDFSAINNLNFWISTFSLTLVLVFENLGILHAQVNVMLDKPEKTSKALKAVSISTIVCALLGSSPPVSVAEGTAGIADGGRTGFTAIICSLLFLISLFFIPFISIIPDEVLAPILIILGCLMSQSLRNINFHDLSEFLPSFLIIVLTPLTYSIVDGIGFGFIAYPICKICIKKGNEVSLPMYIASVAFFIYFIISAYIN
ncbi:MAG: NCS2 family permease [Clostridium neonatale]|uniref:NCS2 family permease n=1 Tax=Clostridium neonatale TaxID=137838 RepID=UPI00291BE011|nr:putative guanine/hypoxanthine permease Pbu [Clostridium neonatale]